MRTDHPPRTLTREPARVIGILAGGGALPRELAESVRARGAQVHIVALDGEADAEFAGFPVTRLGWGKVGGMIAAFRRARATDVVFAGSVRRPDLKRLRPDLGFVLGLPELLALVLRGGGDDRILRAVVRFFERRGFRVVGAASLAPQLIVGKGALGRAAPTASDLRDIARAVALLGALSPFDIGQGVIVRDGCVEAIEAAENTDAMLARVGERRVAQSGPARGAPLRGGVLVKLVKRGQERRIDLPTIGRQTVLGAAAAGLSGVAVEAGGVIAVRRDEMMARADAAGLFVVGVDAAVAASGETAASPAPTQPAPMQQEPMQKAGGGWRLLTGKAAAPFVADADKGAAVQRVAAAFGAGSVVVVSRGHVLAVEADEGAAVLLARVGSVRQWGAATPGQRRSRTRAGVAVLREARMLTPDAVAQAADAGLAALALADAEAHAIDTEVVRAATAASVALLVRSGSDGGRA